MAGHSAEDQRLTARFAAAARDHCARHGDVAAFKFNTAVAALMGWLNDLEAARDRPVGGDQWRGGAAHAGPAAGAPGPFLRRIDLA